MDEAVLKQFEILWAEIGRRSNAQQALIAATVTATGSIGGLYVTGKASAELLLVLSFVIPTFGLLWLDHARSIDKISDFIGKHWGLTPNWEIEQVDGDSELSRLLIFLAAVSIVFLGPPTAGLIASFNCRAGVPFFLAWFGGAALTMMLSLGWGIQVRDRWKSRRAGSGSGPSL